MQKQKKGKKKLQFPEVYHIDRQEQAAVARVLARGPLSGFVGTPGPEFFGGPEVQALERTFAKYFKVKHAVSFNSATTALQGAMVALGIGPGDEVIVPPYTMSATAMCVLSQGAVPIFADIEDTTYGLDPKSVARKITKRTKAILVVNLFGQAPAGMRELAALAKRHKLALVEDNAQSPAAYSRGRYTGTIGDIGIFSFNVHKTMQAGEGGMLVTNNKHLATRAQMCRNHGENLADAYPTAGPIIGSNYRMTEVTAAIARVQLSKLAFLNKKRIALAQRLTRKLSAIPGITPANVPAHNTHVYYLYPIQVDERTLGVSRKQLAAALTARGFEIEEGYVEPLYWLPIFQKRQAFNKTHFPFDYQGMRQDYSRGSCPTVEKLHTKKLFVTNVCRHPYTAAHVDAFVDTIKECIAQNK